MLGGKRTTGHHRKDGLEPPLSVSDPADPCFYDDLQHKWRGNAYYWSKPHEARTAATKLLISGWSVTLWGRRSFWRRITQSPSGTCGKFTEDLQSSVCVTNTMATGTIQGHHGLPPYGTSYLLMSHEGCAILTILEFSIVPSDNFTLLAFSHFCCVDPMWNVDRQCLETLFLLIRVLFLYHRWEYFPSIYVTSFSAPLIYNDGVVLREKSAD